MDTDWISDLPDPLLIHILSFLKTKEAVRTCKLAKRYRNLWAAVPVLNFDFHDFLQDDVILEELLPEELENYEDKFVQFVDSVLQNREPVNLDSFKLVWDSLDGDPSQATIWLDTVTNLNPKFLFIKICTEIDFDVPDSVFICQSLMEMELHFGFFQEVAAEVRPPSIHLPSLKKLILGYVEIEDEIMKILLSGTPILEELALRKCILHLSSISSDTLKCLVVDNCNKYVPDPHEILISIPSLVYLEIASLWQMWTIKLKNMKSLSESRIHLYSESLILDEVEKPIIDMFLTGLLNVTTLDLELSFRNAKHMEDKWGKEATRVPTFNNLKSLKIGKWSMIQDFGLIANFLLHSPNLEKLTLLTSKMSPETGYTEEVSSLGLRDYLDTVVIICEKIDLCVRQLVKILCAHVKTIRNIKIISSNE